MENSISVLRTFYPVGHGAFYAERFHIMRFMQKDFI